MRLLKHASTRDATLCIRYSQRQCAFQSTHDTGCDVFINKMLVQCQKFQSTRHTGCDAAIAKHLYQQEHFNPRTTRGATVYNIDISGSIIDFNPRATRGATYERGKMQIMEYISIHAPHRARLYITYNCSQPNKFQSPRGTRGA